MSTRHEIPLKIQTSASNCVQTSVSQFLAFYGIDIPPEEIEKAVPVRFNNNGKPIGTLYPDIGKWLIESYGLNVTIHTFDIQIIDRTWASLSSPQLLEKLQEANTKGISTALTPYAPLLIEAYISYLEANGKVDITKCTNNLLQDLLTKGPVLAIVSFNYLYDYPRCKYDMAKKEYGPDAFEGKVIEHSIVLTGFEDGIYYYNDPDSEQGGQHQINDDLLIGAICTAQINSNNYLMSIEDKDLSLAHSH